MCQMIHICSSTHAGPLKDDMIQVVIIAIVDEIGAHLHGEKLLESEMIGLDIFIRIHRYISLRRELFFALTNCCVCSRKRRIPNKST